MAGLTAKAASAKRQHRGRWVPWFIEHNKRRFPYLYPDLFGSSAAFDSAFELNSSSGAKVDNEQLSAASGLLRPFMLRRTKEEVEKGMPPKLETTISCPLSEMQLFWYKRLLLKDSELLEKLERDANSEVHPVLRMIRL